MTKANILPESDLYKWFNTTIYYFHVPLFFIFLVTPTFNSVKAVAVGLVVALAAKSLILTGGGGQHLRSIDGSLKRNLVCTRNEYLRA